MPGAWTAVLSSADTVPRSPVPTSLEGPRGHQGSEMLHIKLEDCCKSQSFKGKIIQKQALIYVQCLSCLLIRGYQAHCRITLCNWQEPLALGTLNLRAEPV